MINLAHGLLSDPESPLLAPYGRTPQSAQIDYAATIVDFLSGDARQCLLEGETGTGKTIGYLVPSVLHAMETGQRLVISTHTINLQDQVMSTLDALLPDLARITGRHLRHARRIGRRNHLSLSVFRRWRDAHVAQFKDEDRRVIDKIDEIMEDHDGMVLLQELEMLLLEEDMISPVDLTLFSINAKTHHEDPALIAYREMIREANGADILVINHALLSLNLLVWDGLLNLRGAPVEGQDGADPLPAILVVDEADQLPDAAEAMSATRMNISLLGSGLCAAGGHGLEAAIEDAVDTFREEADRLRHKDQVPIDMMAATAAAIDISRAAPNLVPRSRNRIRKMLRSLEFLKQAAELGSLYGDEGALEAAEDIAKVVPALKSIAKGRTPDETLVLYWSPIRGQPGLAMRGLQGRDIVSRLWRMTPAVRTIFTSATLNLKKRDRSSGQDIPLKGFSLQIGMGGEDFTSSVRNCISPTDFGTMSFRIAHPNLMPRPVLNDEDGNGVPPLNEIHAKLSIRMMADAARQGGRVLVLVPSYRDCILWEKLMRSDQALAPLLPRMIFDSRRFRNLSRRKFRERGDAILVSPGSWVGLDMPGLIRHIVFPRLPLQPPDVARDVLYERFLKEQGTYREQDVQARRFNVMIEKAIQKMMQGIGRGIRSRNDDVTIWIADPRWPCHHDCLAPLRRSWSPRLVAAVPRRFQHLLFQAQIWIPEAEAAEGEPVQRHSSLRRFLRRSRFEDASRRPAPFREDSA